MPKDSAESLINLLVAFIIIYVGAVVLYSVNPILGILFVILGLYILVNGVRSGKFEL